MHALLAYSEGGAFVKLEERKMETERKGERERDTVYIYIYTHIQIVHMYELLIDCIYIYISFSIFWISLRVVTIRHKLARNTLVKQSLAPRDMVISTQVIKCKD